MLHYVFNNKPLRDGDLLLIDAAAEFGSYAADITRTFPVNGRFSAAQKDVYELVLAAQMAAIGEVRPGSHWNAPHEAAVRVLTQGMVDLETASTAGRRPDRIAVPTTASTCTEPATGWDSTCTTPASTNSMASGGRCNRA